MQRERGHRYSQGVIVFHWTIAALVLINLFIGLFHETLLEGIRTIPTHKAIGVTVLVLSIARLAWRLTHRPPGLPNHLREWERAAAKAVHWLFYALLLAMPLTGWLWSSDVTRPRPFSWFGLFDVPLFRVGHDLARTLHDAHETLGLAMTGLVLLHIAAALRHHFVLRDQALARMLPQPRRNG